MDDGEIATVVDLWADSSTKLFDEHPEVQVFENNGAAMGASNPHPHGQIWAMDALPTHIAREADRQSIHVDEHGQRLLDAYQRLERSDGARTVVETANWLVVVPFWAVWPFETMVLPVRPVGRIAELTSAERQDLAQALGRLLRAYDKLFDVDFPYSMGWHQRPHGIDDSWVLHAHFNPPLLRSATVRKFMVGFEMFGEPQRDITAETAAERLRDVAGA
jgi:UDPglucose--hexose-1-phosphate uridylyltransferase